MPWAVGEMGVRMARIVTGIDGFSEFKKMLDPGGGHGLFSLYIVQASRTLESIIFDHAPVTELANAMLQCGFRTVRSRTLEIPIGLMELDIARK